MSDPAPPNDQGSEGSADPAAGGSQGSHFPESVPPEDRVAGREGLASDLRPDTPTPLRPASYDPVSLRHIDWPAAFPFVHLFRGFRMAMHPSKLLLALAAVLLLYTGGRLLDGLWMNRHLAFPDEAGRFAEYMSSGEHQVRSFGEIRREQRLAASQPFIIERGEVADRQNVSDEQIDIDDIEDYLVRRRNTLEEQAEKEHGEEMQRIASNSSLSDEQRAASRATSDRNLREARRAIYDHTARRWREVTLARGKGLFHEFYDYEVRQFDRGLSAILRLDVGELLGAIYGALYLGPLWGISQHPLYFTIFFLWFLVLAAVFGGAICRIAAVQVARDEKISLRSALRFSTGKFVSFLSAPLIPILIILAIAVVVGLAAGAVGWIPWLGELVISIGFFLALLAGFVITLVLIGLVGGFSLMYPTVAAEGTDSFDAISRSFSYLYARPWRLAFYALAALVYGAITYLFVRLFVWLVLLSSHAAASMLLFRDAAGRNDVLEAMWPPPPSYDRLSYEIDFINLDYVQSFSAVVLAMWIYLMIGLVGAYAVSLYFSLSSIVYFLMRREVDATELDDVYLDPHDEEFGGYSDVPEADTEAPMEPAEAGRG